MRKFLITILSLLAALIAYVILISRYKEKKQTATFEYKPKVNRMRDIENPFIETPIKQVIKPVTAVAVVNNDYNWWKVHKSDILYVIGIVFVCVMVIIASFFANKSRVVSEEIEQNEKEQLDSSVTNSLNSIEETTISLTEMVDSLNAYIKEKTQRVRQEPNGQPKTQLGERKKK